MARPKLSSPSHLVSSLIWAVGLALYIWLGALVIGMSQGTSLIITLVSGFGIFLCVFAYGGDEPRRS